MSFIPLVDQDSYAGNNPPAANLLTVAQSPSGTSIPVTGRIASATATYLADLNVLNAGTTPAPTGNLPRFPG
jgi:hypothetical protein